MYPKTRATPVPNATPGVRAQIERLSRLMYSRDGRRPPTPRSGTSIRGRRARRAGPIGATGWIAHKERPFRRAQNPGSDRFNHPGTSK